MIEEFGISVETESPSLQVLNGDLGNFFLKLVKGRNREMRSFNKLAGE